LRDTPLVRFKTIDWIGRALRKAGNEVIKVSSLKGTWIDVGAHKGESCFDYASRNPSLRVYAFEPNLRVAVRLMGHASNYIVIPMAVAEEEGQAEFHINQFTASSSLLPMNEESRKTWIGGEALAVESTTMVPTIRLDTFMRLAGIEKVDYLKIDAQGMDLAVLRSVGSRLADVAKITIEVTVSPRPLYVGATSKVEAVRFLQQAGFELVQTEKETYGQEENLTFVRVK
jgi:FkbM family methyltransferase